MTKHASLAPLLERFFIQRLMQQRQASPHTIGSYRDTFRQLLKFAERTLHKPPSRLSFAEVDAPLIVAFLNDLENHQGISVRSRNPRLTAQAGVDRAVIALWLGHESVETTQIYLEATLAMKEAALAKTSPYSGKSPRFRPDDNLLEFLNSL
ncbi:site-specific integrase [Mesorhizobium sp. M00.F.Ca.ET.217.01.1.1]|uniref:site-specific integrase n=1 Tax=Mesorhizobium sp. M00.F.Ca.ET.217.01.1.1 TaxID=2500529 RepID=UPI000FD9ED4E|nr:site-specific integrase [Mesorhizobium sp. M00.F.Ca.ET.217.01.1.1]TGQ12716.1 hypothetical protein EN860_032025 [Mesorhizobium sp. M00.F.Ca.ET.217.01.1.1]TGV84082.1 hypothetical protein EN801_031645 [Mesorhizobium sp. M00.F.Ca.ET.158.01.1.1]